MLCQKRRDLRLTRLWLHSFIHSFITSSFGWTETSCMCWTAWRSIHPDLISGTMSSSYTGSEETVMSDPDMHAGWSRCISVARSREDPANQTGMTKTKFLTRRRRSSICIGTQQQTSTLDRSYPNRSSHLATIPSCPGSYAASRDACIDLLARS